jgi:hypothetical protein
MYLKPGASTYWRGSASFGSFQSTKRYLATYNINKTDMSNNWATATNAVQDHHFGTFEAAGGMTITPNAGTYSGVTFKIERGPDGSVDAWKV